MRSFDPHINYYAQLGVDSNASLEKIKSAYKKLAKRFHPDKNSQGEARFKEIGAAYEVLTDAHQKAAYDRESSFGYKGASADTTEPHPQKSQPKPKSEPQASSQPTQTFSKQDDFSWLGFWQPMAQLVSIVASASFIAMTLLTAATQQKASRSNLGFSMLSLFVLFMNRDEITDLLSADTTTPTTPTF